MQTHRLKVNSNEEPFIGDGASIKTKQTKEADVAEATNVQ